MRLRSGLFVVAVLAVSLTGVGPTRAAGPEQRAILRFAEARAVPGDAALLAAGVRPLYRFASIPAVAVSAPQRALAGFARRGARVQRDRPIRLLLDTATRTTRAADVWGTGWWPLPSDVHREGRVPLHDADGELIDGRGVTVGVVDTGVNGLHPDLWYAKAHAEAMPWEPKTLECFHLGPTVIVSSPDCDETSGHGTHVAGIVAGNAAAIRNGLSSGVGGRPFVGVAPGASIVAGGLGSPQGILGVASALDWMYQNAEQYGIRVINNSWGDSPVCSDDILRLQSNTLNEIVTRLVEDKGVAVVFAAGNYLEGPTRTTTYSRNVTPGVISVANYSDGEEVSRANQVAPRSSDGCVGDDIEPYVWTWPDVAAPGTSITSTTAYTGTSIPPIGRPPFYAAATGTSMAAPHVAGVAALMVQANPALTPAEIEQILIDTATPWDDGVSARGFTGSRPHWGGNALVRRFTNRDACRITPAHAQDPEAAAALFPRFDELPNPERFVCRDFKRGGGLVDAYAAVQRAIELRQT